MATEVKIPTLGESISSGILAAWHIQDGDYVESGESLYDLETDKITSEGTADVSGVIELKVSEGDEVEIGAVVAVIDESASKPETSEKPENTDKKDPADSQARQAEDKPDKAPVKQDDQSDGDTSQSSSTDEPQHPASVRRIADESGIDPSTVKGSGKGGRVTKSDMQEAVEKTRTSSSQESKPASERESRRKMTPLRRTIAQRLVKAQQETAMLTTFNEVDMSAVMAYRKTHQEAFVEKHGIKLGFMSFFTKAVVQALKAYPAVNARIEGEDIVSQHYFDVGIAVSTPKGLMVPVVRDCDRKSFAEIEKDIIAFAGKAKEGKIKIEDLQGGVFTITNGGIFGSMLSTPILNTPQSGILGMHTIQERPVAVNGEVKIRPMMYLALSYDHRLVDGREAVGFLVSVKQAIENPIRLMLEI